MERDSHDSEAFATPEEWFAGLRLTRDLREAASLLSPQQQRILVDLYYQVQDGRKRTANQLRHAKQEPNAWITFMTQFMTRMEKLAAGALDIASNEQAVSRWAKCAPPGSLVQISNGRWNKPGGNSVPIETLRNGQLITAFDRHKARLTQCAVQVGCTPYDGPLITVETADMQTRVTPQHKWLVRFDAKADAHIIYLMQRGPHFRIGRCKALRTDVSRKNGRLFLRGRVSGEGAEHAWVLRYCADGREAALYENLISTEYGLPQVVFKAPKAHSRNFDQALVDDFFSRLDPAQQFLRAMRCLIDHGLTAETPFFGASTYGVKETVNGIMVHAQNLVPGMMSVPVPLRGGGIDWQPIRHISQTPYNGPVYSLDVAEHHKYVQDGMVTCNSVFGIGPVLAAGLAAYIDITRTPTVSALWSLAGMNPTAVWNKGELRPWNAHLKTLAWKIGDSFCKFHNNPKCTYGHLYAARKELEVQRNATGQFREQAEKTLVNRNIRDKVTRAIYEAGQLPAGRLDLRARRVAVKRFLSHYWQVAYYEQYHIIPPPPYINETEPEAHQHYVAPEGYEEIFVYPELSQRSRHTRVTRRRRT